MEPLIFESLRGQDDPCRILVRGPDSQPEVIVQVTAPRFIERICCGRPVEELPRMVTVLGPVHHLIAALALDRLFQVDPPELAQNMRRALLQAQYCSAHLRKMFFFLTRDPNWVFEGRPWAGRFHSDKPSRPCLKKIMHRLGLALEAEEILGGRPDHPLTAVVGGVSRFLEDDHIERLAAISEILVAFGRELFESVGDWLVMEKGLPEHWSHQQIPPLTGLSQADDNLTILVPPLGRQEQTINPEHLGSIVAFRQEPWTYQALAYLQEKGWPGLDVSESFFYVGPLARFNAGRPAATPRAEETRQRMIASWGEPPVYTLGAAFGALLLEFLQAAEILQILSTPEKLTGPALRTIPQNHALSTWAALETPQGFSWHNYQVNEQGIVQQVTILEGRSANQALKYLLAKEVVGAALKRKEDPAVMKERLELTLLPF